MLLVAHVRFSQDTGSPQCVVSKPPFQSPYRVKFSIVRTLVSCFRSGGQPTQRGCHRRTPTCYAPRWSVSGLFVIAVLIQPPVETYICVCWMVGWLVRWLVGWPVVLCWVGLGWVGLGWVGLGLFVCLFVSLCFLSGFDHGQVNRKSITLEVPIFDTCPHDFPWVVSFRRMGSGSWWKIW